MRRFPGSRRHPQFGSESLKVALQAAGIEYRHFPDLGARRTNRIEGSPNTAWRVEAFNAYADYLQSQEFQRALADLMAWAGERRSVIMCAEALPWSCHRRLIADALIARGWTVQDIVGPKQVREHDLPPFAKVADGQVTYPGETLF